MTVPSVSTRLAASVGPGIADHHQTAPARRVATCRWRRGRSVERPAVLQPLVVAPGCSDAQDRRQWRRAVPTMVIGDEDLRSPPGGPCWRRRRESPPGDAAGDRPGAIHADPGGDVREAARPGGGSWLHRSSLPAAVQRGAAAPDVIGGDSSSGAGWSPARVGRDLQVDVQRSPGDGRRGSPRALKPRAAD